MDASETLRIAAMADLHYGRGHRDEMVELLAEASAAADVLLLCGDLTDHGHPKEARMLVEDVRANVRADIMAVFGNHDLASDTHDELIDVLGEGGIQVLDGECASIGSVGFAGVRGFCGGFGPRSVHPFGERELRDFINVTVEESLKLETALSQLDTEYRVVLLHYAPIRDTLDGEPPEIYPFLGSSRLEDPINHYDASVVFHGHGHKGAPRGRTAHEIPVFNVSIPVLKRTFPDQPAFHLYEIGGDGADAVEAS